MTIKILLFLCLLAAIFITPVISQHKLYISAAPTGNSLQITSIDGLFTCGSDDLEICGTKSRMELHFDDMYKSQLDSYEVSFVNPIRIDQTPTYLNGSFGPDAMFVADITFPERIDNGSSIRFHIRVLWKAYPDLTQGTYKTITVKFGTTMTSISATAVLPIVKKGADSDVSLIRRMQPKSIAEFTSPRRSIEEEKIPNYFQARLSNVRSDAKRYLITPYGSLTIQKANFNIQCTINSQPMSLELIQLNQQPGNPFYSMVAKLPDYFDQDANVHIPSNVDTLIECFNFSFNNRFGVYGLVFQFIPPKMTTITEYFDQPQYTIEKWNVAETQLTETQFNQYVRPSIIETFHSGYLTVSGAQKIYHSQYRYVIALNSANYDVKNNNYKVKIEMQNTSGLDLIDDHAVYYFGVKSSGQPATVLPRLATYGTINEEKEREEDTTRRPIFYWTELTPSIPHDSISYADSTQGALLIVEMELWHKAPPDTSEAWWVPPTFVVKLSQPYLTEEHKDSTFPTYAITSLSRFTKPTASLRDLSFDSDVRKLPQSSPSGLDSYDVSYQISSLAQNLNSVLFDVAVREYEFVKTQSDNAECFISNTSKPDDKTTVTAYCGSEAMKFAHPEGNRSLFLKFNFIKGQSYQISCKNIFLTPTYSANQWKIKNPRPRERIPVHFFGYTDDMHTQGVWGYSYLKVKPTTHIVSIIIAVVVGLVLLVAASFALYHFVYIKIWKRRQEKARVESIQSQSGLIQNDFDADNGESPFGDNHYRVIT